MPQYTITADSHLVLETNKRGDITKKSRLVRGDTVEMSEADAERLVKTGGLVLSSEAKDAGTPEGTPDYAPAQDGATGGSGDSAERTTSAPLDRDGDVDIEPVEKVAETYTGDEWTKERLQGEAESRGLSKSGTKEDIAARLVEDDNSDDES